MNHWILAGLLAGSLALGGDDFQREDRKNGRQALDAMEGKAPPALVLDGWVNTEGRPLHLPDLRGKVVVLDFWGVW